MRAEEMVELPTLKVVAEWHNIFRNREKSALETLLPRYLLGRRWFGGKARTIHTAEIAEAIPIPPDSPLAFLTLIKVEYTEGEPETYRLPLTLATAEQVAQMQEVPAAVARVRVQKKGQEEEGVLFDAVWDKTFLRALLGMASRVRRFTGKFGEIVASPTREFRGLLQSPEEMLEPSLMKAEQRNTSVVYGDLFILKLYRRAEEGWNPDLGIGRYLTEKQFPSIAPVASALEHRGKGRESSTVLLLQRFIPNEGDAWSYTLDTLSQYYQKALAHQAEFQSAQGLSKSLVDLVGEPAPVLAQDLIGIYLDEASLLGQRTGELHVTLSQNIEDPNFTPEPFTDFYRRGLYQSIASLVNQHFTLLRQRIRKVPSALQDQARRILDLDVEAKVKKRLQLLRDRRFTVMRIRCHGDYHLGQVLYTGKDFIIIDFEGEPTRPLSVRRMKGSPLRDVAGMLRSFHYAAYAALFGQAAGIRSEDFSLLEPAARFWYAWVARTFLKGYLNAAGQEPFLLPKTQEELKTLLDVFLLEKAMYEMGYELNNRPDWAKIPFEGILQLVEFSEST